MRRSVRALVSVKPPTELRRPVIIGRFFSNSLPLELITLFTRPRIASSQSSTNTPTKQSKIFVGFGLAAKSLNSVILELLTAPFESVTILPL